MSQTQNHTKINTGKRERFGSSFVGVNTTTQEDDLISCNGTEGVGATGIREGNELSGLDGLYR